MFLSTENPPRDPLSSSSSSSPSSNLLRLTTSPSHELGQSSFSIRDYAYSNRKNNIKNSWPFSTKSLQLCSSHGVTDPLPPFQKLSRLSNKFETTPSVSQVHQTIAEASKRVCNQSRIIENGLGTSRSVSKSKVEIVVAATSNNKSKKCGRGGGMVKSKEDSCGTASESTMASKTCPICKTFSSASNTTLNAHIDQCLSVDSSVPPVSSKPNKPRVKPVDSAVPPVSSKPSKPRVSSVGSAVPPVSSKPRVKLQVKVKTLVDIYTTAKRCTLEDLDKRNGTQWASVLSCTNRVAADKCEVSKKRKGSPVGVGPVYIDAKGQKLRILTEFSEKKTTTTLREQQEDGSSEKKSSSQGSKENKKRGRRKKHGKCIKLTSHKANTAENVLEYQREGSSKGPRRIYNQRMLAKRGLVSKKLNEKGHKLSALRYQPSDDDDEDDSWSGEDRLVLRGADTSATGSSPLNKQKLRSQVSRRSKTMFESKRAHSRSSRAQIEEKSLTGAYSNNTVHSKKSLASIQEDKHPPGKNVRDASPRATSMRMQLLSTLCFLFLQLLSRGDASASHSNRHRSAPHWLPATATWYGSPEGDGSSGGACGYGSLVDVKPFKARVGAVSPLLFKSGEGCGACYKVRCLDKTICSKRAVTIIVTDQSPSGPSARAKHTHFDLSGAAFGHLSIPGHSGIMRNRGLISVLYRQTACKYREKNIAFHVNAGSTAYWLSLLIEYEDGEGDIGSMHIRQAGSKEWIAMKHIWGANWCIVGGPLKGPLSVKLTTLSNNKTLSAADVIPKKWVPKATYTSRLNFSPVL